MKCAKGVFGNVAHILNQDIVMLVIEIHVYGRRILVCLN